MTIRVAGIGTALPEKIVTNHDLAQSLDTTDEWIRTRTGIVERRIAGEGETTLTMSLEAAYEALAPFARLAGGGTPLMAAKGESNVAEGGDGTTQQDLLLAMVLSRSLGQDEPHGWPGVAEGTTEPPALRRLPDLLALSDAAAAGRRGETVVLAALALGDAAEPHPLALGYAVSALRAVGLGADARALALEAAVAAGL